MAEGWVRLWHDMPTDPKWRVIAKRSGRSISDVIAVFTFVMVNASGNAVKRGETHNLFHDDIAAALDVEKEAIDAIIQAMTGKVIDSKGVLTGWEKRQPKREDSKSTERVREFRKRNETQRNAVKRPDTDTDTDTEEEKKTSLREAKESDGAEAPPPPVENSNGHSKPSSRGTRLSEGWEPLEEHVTLAKGWGLSDDEIKWEHAKFTDYWMAKSGSRAAMVDWDRTWCNWMRRVADDKRNRVQRQKSYEEKGKPQQRPN